MSDSSKLSTDIVDGSLNVRLDTRVYDHDSVLAAAYRFTDKCSITVDQVDSDHVEAKLTPIDGTTVEELKKIACDFTNEVLDQQLRRRLEQRYGGLRDTIVKCAFDPVNDESKKKEPELSGSGYTTLPFTFKRFDDQTYLLVNQAGEYIFISAADLKLLANENLAPDSAVAQDLRSKHFISHTDTATAVNLLATKLRTRKGFLRDFTVLHMVVVTGYCNCKCEYCHASSTDPGHGSLNMTKETARRVVDTILECPSQSIKIEFQGGEPLLNLDTVRYIVEYAKEANEGIGKHIEFVICTNLALMTPDIIEFLKKHEVDISTSLDGPKDLHDLNRLSRDGSSSYDAFRDNLELVRSNYGPYACSPLLTITRRHLTRLREVIDEYVRLGFEGIFLRSLNPYGMAKSNWDDLAYPVEEFVDAYKDALDYIIEVNLNGRRFVDYYTTLLLTRILTPFSTGFVDLQSPSGAGISGVIYDYDGDVYPADEARMLARTGDRTFRLGSVYEDSYMDIFSGDKLHEITSSSCVETLPGCAWCAYQLYCGGDPIRSYVESGDTIGHRPTSDFCKKNSAIFDHLFKIIQENDPEIMDVFWSWITHRSLEDVR